MSARAGWAAAAIFCLFLSGICLSETVKAKTNTKTAAWIVATITAAGFLVITAEFAKDPPKDGEP